MSSSEANASGKPGPVGVYGATGYTGKLIAAELARRGAEIVLSGRNAAKLNELASKLGADATVIPASVDNPGALRRMLEPCAAVIACAGPFCDVGEPVLAAAAETGTHYIDTTGEQPFIRMTFDRYDEPARASGSVVVSGMGFDYAPGDMLASLTAEGMGPLDELTLAYSVRGFQPTRGTFRSAVGMLGDSDVVWRDGELVTATGPLRQGRWDFGAEVGSKPMIRYPSGEQVTVPRHVETARVRCLLATEMFAPGPLAGVMALTAPLTSFAMRTPLRRGALALGNRLPEGAAPDKREAVRFTIACEARRGPDTRRGVLDGRDVYGITAVSTVHGALLCAAPGYDRSGALAPARAFDPREFLGRLGDHGLSYEIGRLPKTASGNPSRSAG